jgi:hypothetical protein
VEERPARVPPGSDPRFHTSAWKVERTSVSVGTRHPSRGDAGTGGLVVAHAALARSEHPVKAERARGSASRSSAGTTREVRGTGFEEGIRPPKRRREPSLDLVRSTLGMPLRRRTSRGSSARFVPARGRTKAKAGKVRHLISAERGTKQLAVGARASSYCRSRQNALGLREARHLQRSGRKPGRCSERVNGSLTIGGRSGAQAQGPAGGKRGASPRRAAILIT